MHTCQAKLAESLIETLEKEGEFERVRLIGSLSDGSYDTLSDIDLVLECHSRAPWENVQLASKILEKVYGSLLHDWAGSLIPDKYLISQFLPGYDIMWWVDIGCYRDKTYGDISRHDIEEEWNSHIAKLLVMNAKYYLRSTDEKLRIVELYNKVIGEEPKMKDIAELFMSVRNTLDDGLLSDEFVKKMDRTLKVVANQSLEVTQLAGARSAPQL